MSSLKSSVSSFILPAKFTKLAISLLTRELWINALLLTSLPFLFMLNTSGGSDVFKRLFVKGDVLIHSRKGDPERGGGGGGGGHDNRTGRSVDDGALKLKNWLDQWHHGKLGTGSRV